MNDFCNRFLERHFSKVMKRYHQKMAWLPQKDKAKYTSKQYLRLSQAKVAILWFCLIVLIFWTFTFWFSKIFLFIKIIITVLAVMFWFFLLISLFASNFDLSQVKKMRKLSSKIKK